MTIFTILLKLVDKWKVVSTYFRVIQALFIWTDYLPNQFPNQEFWNETQLNK